MADRKVRVLLVSEVADYVKGMDEAAKATRETGSEAEKLAQKRDAIQEVGRASMAFGVMAAAGVTLAVSKWADFDQAMSQVQAATGEGEVAMSKLSDAALEAGARTVFSAEEAANAIEELAKAGVSTADILSGGLDGALDLAAAGGLGVADAAGIAATALKTFNLEGKDMAHVADLLAAGAGKAMGDVTDLSAALNQSAMVANATGLSIEETTAGLAAFASQGLLGSDAGTSFKTMLMSLSGPSGKAKEEMDRLGISAFDASGNFIGLAEFAGSLEKALAGMSKEQQQATLKTIFGADAIRAATVLYSEGEEGISGWIDAVNDQGYAAEQAATRLDNLKGDLEALGGALDTALIKTGSGANDVLREMVQWLTGAIDLYSDLPPELQSAALGFGIAAAAVGILGGGAIFTTIMLGELKVALSTLGATASGAQSAVLGIGRFLAGPWGIALMAAAAVTTVLVGEKQKLASSARELADTLDAESGAVTENSTAWAANKLQQEGVLSAAKRLGIDADVMTEAWLGNSAALKTVNDRLGKFKNDADFRMNNTGWKGWSDDLADVGYALDGSNKMLAEAKTRHDELTEATEGSAGSTGDNVDALGELEGAAADANNAVEGLADSIRNFGKEQFDVEKSTIQFYDALDALKENLESGSASLDTTTEAGRATVSAMLDAASRTNDYAASVAAMGGSTEEVQGILDAGRQKIIETRIALGDTEAQARAYADQLIATPAAVVTAVQLNGVSKAQYDLDSYLGRLNSIPSVVSTEVRQFQALVYKDPAALYKNANGGVYENGIKAFANSGFEPGIYPYTPGGIHKFAEEFGEAYISMDPARRQRSVGVWQKAGEGLGVMQEIRAALGAAAGARGPQSVTQQNSITMVERDPRLVARQLGRELKEALG